MDQLLSQADNAGLSQQEGKDTLGGILALLKAKLGEENFGKIEEALPSASQLADNADTKANSGAGGLLQSAMGMLGGQSNENTTTDGDDDPKIDSMAKLMGFLGQAGISPKQVQTFLPMVVAFLKDKAGIDVSNYLKLPASGTTASGGTTTTTTEPSSSTGGGGNDLMQQAQGFLSSFTK